ncbi:F-box/WD repeat-containing protein pof10 [Linum grandiflorum]
MAQPPIQRTPPTETPELSIFSIDRSVQKPDKVTFSHSSFPRPKMERLPAELCLKIFCSLDHPNLASAQQVCKKWKAIGSEDTLWSNLFNQRWGTDRAEFYAPLDSRSWKDVYAVQDREIQRYLGSPRQRKGTNKDEDGESSSMKADSCIGNGGILDKILFFIGDLEVASADAKRGRLT